MEIGSLTGSIAIEDQFSSTFDLAVEKVKSFAESFEGMTGDVITGAALVVGAVGAITAAVTALGVEGSTIDGVTTAFDRLSTSVGSTGEEMRHALDEGTKGTVSSLTLMKSTISLLSSGVKVGTDDFETMGKVARELGKATGTDAAGGLEILSGALLTGRVRALQHAGILVDLKQGESDYALNVLHTTTALDALQKKEADRITIMQASKTWLERVGESHLSFKEQVMQAKVAVTEWIEKLEVAVATSPGMQNMLNAIKTGLQQAFGGDSKSLMDLIVNGVNEFAKSVTAAVPYVVSFVLAIKDVWHAIEERSDLLINTAKVVGAFAAAWAVWTVGGALVVGIVDGFAAIASGITGMTAAMALNPLGAVAVAAAATALAITSYATAQANAALQTETAAAQLFVMNKAIDAGDKALIGLTPSAKNAADAALYLAGGAKKAADAHTEVAKATDEHKKAIELLVKQLTVIEDKPIVLAGAFAKLSEKQLENVEVQKKLLSLFDQQLAAHVALTAGESAYYLKMTETNLAIRDKGIQQLLLDGVTLQAIETEKRHGLSLDAIALKHHATIDSLKEFIVTETEYDKAITASLTSQENAWTEWTKVVLESLNVTAFEKAKAAIVAMFDSQVQAMDRAKEAHIKSGKEWTAVDQELYTEELSRYKGLQDLKLAYEVQKMKESNVNSQEHYQHLADIAKATLKDALEISGGITTTETVALSKAADEAQLLADHWVTGQSAMTTAITTTTTAVQGLATATVAASLGVTTAVSTTTAAVYAEADAWLALERAKTPTSGGYDGLLNSSSGSRGGSSMERGYGINQNPNLVPIDGGTKVGFGTTFSIPHHADGGSFTAGQPIMVGERGPEIVVPPMSGSVIPNEALGGTTITMNINGVWDPATIHTMADMLNQATMRRSGRKFSIS